MENAVRAAQSVPLLSEQEIIHLLPQEFIFNDRGGINNPLGLIGSQLDVNLHVITCDSALHQSLINAVNKTRVEVKRVVLQSMAAGSGPYPGRKISRDGGNQYRLRHDGHCRIREKFRLLCVQ